MLSLSSFYHWRPLRGSILYTPLCSLLCQWTVNRFFQAWLSLLQSAALILLACSKKNESNAPSVRIVANTWTQNQWIDQVGGYFLSPVAWNCGGVNARERYAELWHHFNETLILQDVALGPGTRKICSGGRIEWAFFSPCNHRGTTSCTTV